MKPQDRCRGSMGLGEGETERGCVRSTSRSNGAIPTRCGWVFDHCRAPFGCGLAALCCIAGFFNLPPASNALPITNRRNGGLEICATPNGYRGPRNNGESGLTSERWAFGFRCWDSVGEITIESNWKWARPVWGRSLIATAYLQLKAGRPCNGNHSATSAYGWLSRWQIRPGGAKPASR